MQVTLAIIAAITLTAAKRYDHAAHEKAVREKNVKEIACNSCHKLEAKNAWEQRMPVGKAGGVHTPCSNAGCHQDVYARFKKKRDAPFCFACHVNRLGKELQFPPYRERGAGDFYLSTFGHKEHFREGNKGCPQCHTLLSRAVEGSSKEMKRVSHDRCGNQICHGEAIKPLMRECSGCHTLKGADDIPSLSSSNTNIFRVRKTFSHTEHAQKSPKDECGTCHTNVAVARGVQVPLPQMIACETCHNGQGGNAFSALGTSCGRCHLGTSSAEPHPPERFLHKLHEEKGVKVECKACHGSAANGELLLPGKDHAPCVEANCHAKEFRASDQKLCFSCHPQNTPWKGNPARDTFKLPEGILSEFWVGFSHKTHFEHGVGSSACGTCHFDQAGTKPTAVPTGLLAPSHVLCAKCHEKDSKPFMPDCAECHAFESKPNIAGPRGDPMWRVAAKFKHDTHRTDVRTKPNLAPLACDACHRGVIETPKNQPLPHPTMAGCADCHDGAHAFKTTGHACSQCHGPAAVLGKEQSSVKSGAAG